MEIPHRRNVRMPTIDSFDGTTNSNDHIDIYKAHIYIQNVDDASFYRYFPATLKGITQKWFNGLPDGSVTSFLYLA